MNKKFQILIIQMLFILGTVFTGCAQNENIVFNKLVDSILMSNSGISVKLHGNFSHSIKNIQNKTSLSFKNPQDILNANIWHDIDSMEAVIRIKEMKGRLLNHFKNNPRCQEQPIPSFSEINTGFIGISSIRLNADIYYNYGVCPGDAAIFSSAYLIVYNEKDRILTELSFFTSSYNPTNNPDDVINSISFTPKNLNEKFMGSQSETGNDLLQIYDSLVLNDGYILWMGETKCSLMDRKGTTIYNFPGNLVSFINHREQVVSHSSNILLMYDKNIDVLWSLNKYVHHELTVSPDDNILLLSCENYPINNKNLQFDNIFCINSDGQVIYKWSTYEHRKYLLNYIMQDTILFRYKVKRSTDTDSVLFHVAKYFNKPEFFHMNAIHVLQHNEAEKKDTIFKAGNLLLSFCCYNDSLTSFLAIVDPARFEILWHYSQENKKPMHTPSMLENGHILVYSNSDKSGTDSSSIDEIDPFSKKVVWSYTEKYPDIVKRNGQGTCQRLNNGNTFISNSNGYIYEITPEKKIVWQYYLDIDRGSWIYRAFYFPKEKLKWLENND